MHGSAADSAAGQRDRKHMSPMIATGALVELRRATEFGETNDQRLVQEARAPSDHRAAWRRPRRSAESARLSAAWFRWCANPSRERRTAHRFRDTNSLAPAARPPPPGDEPIGRSGRTACSHSASRSFGLASQVERGAPTAAKPRGYRPAASRRHSGRALQIARCRQSRRFKSLSSEWRSSSRSAVTSTGRLNSGILKVG